MVAGLVYLNQLKGKLPRSVLPDVLETSSHILEKRSVKILVYFNTNLFQLIQVLMMAATGNEFLFLRFEKFLSCIIQQLLCFMKQIKMLHPRLKVA